MVHTNLKDTALTDTLDVGPVDALYNAEEGSTLLGEVHRAIRVTLEELAMLAGLATADTGIPQDAHINEHAPSAYSLLLENSLFRR